MKMHSLGHEVPDYEGPAMVSSGNKKGKTRTVFPEIHLRGDDVPKLPEGEFYFVAKAKKVGYRNPVDDGAEKSCDVAIMEFAPVSSAEAAKLASGAAKGSGEGESRTPRRSLRESVEMAKAGHKEEDEEY